MWISPVRPGGSTRPSARTETAALDSGVPMGTSVASPGSRPVYMVEVTVHSVSPYTCTSAAGWRRCQAR